MADRRSVILKWVFFGDAEAFFVGGVVELVPVVVAGLVDVVKARATLNRDVGLRQRLKTWLLYICK
jgi:hypothetical protein